MMKVQKTLNQKKSDHFVVGNGKIAVTATITLGFGREGISSPVIIYLTCHWCGCHLPVPVAGCSHITHTGFVLNSLSHLSRNYS